MPTETRDAVTGTAGDLTDDHALAVHLARGAGRVLLAAREDGGDGARGDRVAHEHLVDGLAVHRPGDAVLSEEAADDAARLTAERVWIVDPLDGTREYGEGRDDWAVHVALWVGGDLVAGAVALPGRGQVLATGGAGDAVVDRRPAGGALRLAVSRSRAPELVEHVRAALGADVRPMGSAGVKAMAVVTGAADAYVHAGGQYEWDSAAPVAVAHAHGLHTSRVDGSALAYNRPDPYLPDLLVCRPEHRDRLLDVIAAATVTPREHP